MKQPKTKREIGDEATEQLQNHLEFLGVKSFVTPGSGSKGGGDIQIHSKMFGKLQGEVKAKENAFGFDYKSLYQDNANKFLAKKSHDKKFLITIELSFFAQLLKLIDEYSDHKGIKL